MTRCAVFTLVAMVAACSTYTPIRTHFNKGVRHYNDENWAGAAREYRLAIEEDPMDMRARFNLAMTLEEMGRVDAARAEYEWILAYQPWDLRASVNLAAIEIDAGDRDAGYARLLAMVERYDTVPLPRVALATHHMRDGNLDEAERLVREGLRIDDADVEGNFLLGEILVRRAAAMEDGPTRTATLDQARACFEAALRHEPGDTASLLALGRLERSTGRPDLARSYYRRVLLQRRRSLEAHEALADLAEEAGDLEEAVEHLWEARRIGGGRAEIASRLARLFGELQQREQQSAAPAVLPSEVRE